MNWISVEDRLPKKKGRSCIVYDSDEGVCESVFIGSKYKWGEPYYGQDLHNNLLKVTHWQHLPQPPK